MREISLGMSRLLTRISEQFDVDLLPYVNKEEHLRFICEHYGSKRKHIRGYLGEGACHEDSEYTKAYLISEAARLLLREIAPKRNKKRKSK